MGLTIELWVAMAIGVVPLVGCIIWWWNDIRYALPVKLRSSKVGDGLKLPPGYMGVPIFGEMLHFLYYFKFLGRPDEYINAKRHKYGDGVGLYRTYLFGTPAIIAWTPEANRFIFNSTEENFYLDWPIGEIVGKNSLVMVQGASHARVRNMVVKSINQPDPLRRIAAMVQPRIVASLESWAQKGRVVAYIEAKKVTFENIGKFFAGLEPGPHLDVLDKYFAGILKGVRSQPINFPGTSCHHAIQCRKKAVEIFRKVMENHKNGRDAACAKDDLLGGLMGLKDEEGQQLSDVEVLDNIVNLVIGGYESTSLSIMWALYYLPQSPKALEKLREEHMPFKKNKRYITSDEITNLPYTKKVVEETIRLANITSFMFRTAAKDVNYKGYIIPKGWKAICWIRYLHTNPEHFDDPMSFNPDRWNEEPKLGTYLPFGGGSRICAGNMLARLQVSIFIHHLVTTYRWELVNPKAEMTYLPYLFDLCNHTHAHFCPHWDSNPKPRGFKDHSLTTGSYPLDTYLPYRKPVDGVEINITKI